MSDALGPTALTRANLVPACFSPVSNRGSTIGRKHDSDTHTGMFDTHDTFNPYIAENNQEGDRARIATSFGENVPQKP